MGGTAPLMSVTAAVGSVRLLATSENFLVDGLVPAIAICVNEMVVCTGIEIVIGDEFCPMTRVLFTPWELALT